MSADNPEHGDLFMHNDINTVVLVAGGYIDGDHKLFNIHFCPNDAHRRSMVWLHDYLPKSEWVYLGKADTEDIAVKLNKAVRE
jgi:hypothetical protein